MSPAPLKSFFVATTTASAAVGFGMFPSSDDGAFQSSDTGVLTVPIEEGLCDRSTGPVDENDSLSFDFEFAGWFSKEMGIPGTDAFITFKRQPVVKFHVTQSILIPDWGVSIPIEGVTTEKLRNAVVRKYVMLAEKARKNTLTEEDRRYWKKLLADSDYGDFCQRTAPAVKEFGTRLCVVDGGVEVAWSTGETEVVPAGLARSLVIVEDGEDFSARVKFIDGKLVSLAEVVPQEKSAPISLDDLFGAV